MEISREKLSAKLDTIPEADRESYVQALKANGYTWKSNTPQAPDSQRPAADIGEAMLTNLPAETFTQKLARGGPAMVGGIIGGAAGSIAGPLGMVGGAALGGAAGEAVRQAASNITAYAFPQENFPINQTRGVIGDTIGAGVSQGAGAGAGLALGALGTALRPGAAKIGSQLLDITTGIPQPYGEAILNDFGVLGRGAIPGRVQDAYNSFESQLGLSSPRLTRELAGNREITAATAGKTMKTADELLTPYIDYNASKSAGKVVYDQAKILSDVQNGTLQPRYLAQNLYEGSQAAAHLQRLAKAGSPNEIANQASIGAQKGTYDSILEALSPGYKDATTAAFEAKAAESTDSVFPLNKNQSPNKLRGYGALHAAAIEGPIASYLTGSPVPAAIGLAAPVIQSPAAFGMAVKAANALEPLAAPVYRVATTGAGALSNAYMSQRRIPTPDPSFQSLGGVRDSLQR